MKHPPQLYTIEVYFGPEIEPYIRSYTDPQKAGQDLRTLKAKMHGANGTITALKLWHHNTLTSQYMAQPPKPRWTWVPPPDGTSKLRPPVPKAPPQPKKRPKELTLAGPLPSISATHKFEL